MTASLPEDVATALSRPGVSDRLGGLARHLTYRSVVSSTNDVALTLAREGAPDGTVVLASAQRAGRGRRGHSWFSPAGAGLYVSVVLKQREDPALTLLAGVAAAEGIRAATGLAIQLEWPNDLVAAEAAGPGGAPVVAVKVGGILCETVGERGTPGIVVGVGINLAAVDFPAELAVTASSLERLAGGPVDRGAILVELLAGLRRWRERHASEGAEAMLARWQELSPSSRGAAVTWRAGDDVRRGVTAGIDASGALRVRVGEQVERIVGGTVDWLVE